MAHVFKSAFGFYNRHYQARPILTICTTNAILAAISDTLSQTYFAPSAKGHDHPPSVRSGVAHAKDKAKAAKETIEAGADHVKTFGEQTVKEVQERGLEGAKDMAEGYKKAGQEMLLSGEEKAAAASFDLPRTGRFVLYNFSVAPLIHTWYSFLDRNFPIANTTATTSTRLAQTMTPALKRMMADQILFAPVGLALLFSGLTVLEGGGVQEIKDKLNTTYLSTLKANYALWPVVQLVNFSVMPLQLRLPVVSAVGIVWNAYVRLYCDEGYQERLAELRLWTMKTYTVRHQAAKAINAAKKKMAAGYVSRVTL
ncbi:hypothetical protein BGX34_011790 [Mortierella sp. NVP85]|nr:hypothetical protein BGX34_011790 [Mortierella sp. NVP85]